MLYKLAVVSFKVFGITDNYKPATTLKTCYHLLEMYLYVVMTTSIKSNRSAYLLLIFNGQKLQDGSRVPSNQNYK